MNQSSDDLFDFSATEATDVSLLPAFQCRRPHLLEIVHAPEVASCKQPRTISLSKNSLVVGRSERADLCIISNDLSRMHARIETCRHGYRIVDLDSRNGVFLNEVRVQSADLRDGDTIQLGNVVLLYHEGI